MAVSKIILGDAINLAFQLRQLSQRNFAASLLIHGEGKPLAVRTHIHRFRAQTVANLLSLLRIN